MKVHVVHDANGNITSLLVAGSEFAGRVGIVPKPGEKVITVEHPDLKGDQLSQRLREIGQQSKVDIRSGTLVNK